MHISRAISVLLLLLAALLAAARADGPAPPSTLDEALARWTDRCGTRRVRPEVPEAGAEAIRALISVGGVAPEEALKLAEKAAFSNDWSAEKVRAWKDALAKEAESATLSSDAFAEKAWAALGKPRPRREAPAPLPKEAPGVRRFEAGAGPAPASVRVRWQGGDIERASALADPDPKAPAEMPPGPAFVAFPPLSAEAAKALGVGDGARAPAVDRYLVLFLKDAVVWWTAELDAFFSGRNERFSAGFVCTPSGEEPRFLLADPARRLGWRAVYVFADVGGKRVPLPQGSVTFTRGLAPEPEPGEARGALGER